MQKTYITAVLSETLRKRLTKDPAWSDIRILTATDDWEREAAAPDDPEAAAAVLTDLPAVCSSLKGICCIALIREDFEIRMVNAYAYMTEPFIPDRPWICQQACHFSGIPYVAAETENIRIRESIREDYPAVSQMLSPQVFLTGAEGGLHFPDNGNGKMDEAFFSAYIRSMYRFYGFGMWTVEYKEPASHGREADRPQIRHTAGWCGLFPAETEDGAELGFVVDPAFRRRGIAYEACSEILRYAREQLQISRVILRTEPANTAAVRLAQKLGMHRMGMSGDGLECWETGGVL